MSANGPAPRQAGEAGEAEQLALVRTRARRGRSKPPAEPAAVDPVAQVAVDVPLAHLDRPFDYLVPEPMAQAAVPGARVMVRFAGQAVSGFVLRRTATSAHEGKLASLSRVVSAEPVLTAEIAALARTVADRYAGTLADVLRLAVPPRHARVEAQPSPPPSLPPEPPAPGPWQRYPVGSAFLSALAEGGAPRAVWLALPGPHWPTEVALAVRATLASGRGAVVVAPDAHDVRRLDAACTAALGPGHHVALTADLGPAERYRRFLAARRGSVRAVLGTRAAAFAPVADLGLVVVWDDGDDLHVEPHAPYPQVREVLGLRAHAAGAAALFGGLTCTAEGAQLVSGGWARPLGAERSVAREHTPRVRVAGEDADLARDAAARSARLPTLAWQVAREALARGPVLVQVPRRGYLPRLSCARCRHGAGCPYCAGPLALASGHAVAYCLWCGRPAGGWACPICGERRFRAQAVGARRTAEELGRAFPSVPVRTSGRASGPEGVLDEVPAEPALVVATPGAEPVAAGGYAAALLLDGWVLLGREDLRAGEEALRRWLSAAALVRPAGEQGMVVVLAPAEATPVRHLVRWDPMGFAERELAERAELGFPPAARLASLTGEPAAVAELLRTLHLPPDAQLLGPVPLRDTVEPAARGGRGGPAQRALVRVPRADGSALVAALRAAQGVRSARRSTEFVRVQVDPLDLG
jgi:primosomal protein N' (replication factor Y)